MIAISINLLNPQKIVLAGKIIEAYIILLLVLQRCIDNQVLNVFRQNLLVIISMLDYSLAISYFRPD